MNLSKKDKQILLQAIKIMETKCSVAVIADEHFLDSIRIRKFPLNVIFKAIIKAMYLEVGQKQEIYLLNEQKATVEIKKVSEKKAILITGWNGIRRSIKNKIKDNKEKR